MEAAEAGLSLHLSKYHIVGNLMSWLILSCNRSDISSFLILLTGIVPGFFLPAYAASKFGVVGLTRSWAVSKNTILAS